MAEIRKLNKYQMFGPQSWKGLHSEQHLGVLFQAQPQRASNTMTRLLAANGYGTWNSLLNSYPVKQFERDDEYYWDVIASASRNIPLVEARDENNIVVTEASGNVGAGVAPFYLVFAEDWSKVGRVS